jgi:glycosyltransferase involved in cell wall biosynthesis
LIDWKALDVVIDAVHQIRGQVPFTLDVVGDGPMRQAWEKLVVQRGLRSIVSFTGWLSQKECAERLQQSNALVLPSLFECGGAVVLEAMATGRPVIATDWGGPADYLDESCGILIKPSSREALVNGFADAMLKLAQSSELCRHLGDAGYQRAHAQFDWEQKIDLILTFYELSARPRSPHTRANQL